VSPWFLLISAFFGAGLTFAGATGTCGLALRLMEMPWNRLSGVAELPSAVCAAGGGTSVVVRSTVGADRLTARGTAGLRDGASSVAAEDSGFVG
jgi:hypothetical protein